MIPHHLDHIPCGLLDGPHPRLKVIELLNYIHYLAKPRPGEFTQEAWKLEMERIHGTAELAIRELGSEPTPRGEQCSE